MKATILTIILILYAVSISVAEVPWEQQTSENSQRIMQLEEDLAEMRDELQALRNQISSDPPAQMLSDPIVGKWSCTNNLFTYDIFFEPNGQMVQQEAVLGNTRVTSWARVGEDQIVLSEGMRLHTEFESQDEFSVENLKSKAVWRCSRIVE